MKRTALYLLPLLLLLSSQGNLIGQGLAPDSPSPRDAGGGGTVSVRLKTTLNRPKGEVLTFFLSPDTKLLAVATWDRKTELWDTETGRLIADLSGRIYRPFSYSDFKPVDPFGPDGRTLVTMDGKEAKLWDAATGRLKYVLSGYEKNLSSTAFSPDGKTVAVASADGTIKLWNVETGRLSAALDPYPVKKYPRWRIVSRFFQPSTDVDLAFSSDGKRVLTFLYDYPTKLWDAATGRLEAVLGEKNWYSKFSPGGRFVLTGRDDFTGTDLWETETGRLKATFGNGHAAFSPDEQWLGPVDYLGKKGLLNLKTMEVEIPLDLDTGFMSTTMFSPDGRTFVLASGLTGHSANLVDVSTGKVTASLPLMAQEGFDIISDYLKYVERISFHPNSRILMGANKQLVRFWDIKTAKQVKEITEGRDPALLSPDGRTLITTAKDKKSILIWRLEA